MEEEKQYWSIEELVELTDKVQEDEIEYKGKSLKFQWCELAESEEPKMVVVDDSMSEDEKNQKYMDMGRERTASMMKKADEKNPDGPSLVSVWNKIPASIKYQVTNKMMGVTSDPNLPEL
tara:strand:+ start:669 stop:1028 length:360 start_codon:yes stop_codon:yes gene_type:complete